jgi:hypothetical protein
MRYRLRQEHQGYIYDWDWQRMRPSVILTGCGLLAAVVFALVFKEVNAPVSVAGALLGLISAKAALSWVYMWTVSPKSTFWPDFPGMVIGPTFISRRKLVEGERGRYILLKRSSLVVSLLAYLLIPPAALFAIPLGIVAWYHLGAS